MSEMEEEQKRRVADNLGERRTRVEPQLQPSEKPLWRSWKDLSVLTVCFAVSILCLGVCVFVFVRSSELQSRVVTLERQQQDAQLSAWMLSLEQVEPFILGRLDKILEEVSATSYDLLKNIWTF